MNLILKSMVIEPINLIGPPFLFMHQVGALKEKAQASYRKEIRSKMSLYNRLLYNQFYRD